MDKTHKRQLISPLRLHSQSPSEPRRRSVVPAPDLPEISEYSLHFQRFFDPFSSPFRAISRGFIIPLSNMFFKIYNNDMKRCILIPSFVEGQITKLISPLPTDLILCADSGLLQAIESDLIPHAVIGDMDSLEEAGFDQSHLPEGILWIQSPREKDLTDTALCMQYALDQGCDEILIIGGLGGRLDHTLANLQNMIGFSNKGIQVSLLDQNNSVHIVTDSSLTLSFRPDYAVSLLSWTTETTGVTLTGMAYPLINATLTQDFPLGISNEIVDDQAIIEVGHGTLLVICSKKNVTT
jgi:thiamine pyrophosphokinase